MNEETFRPLAEALGWEIDTDGTLIAFATAQKGGPPDLSRGYPLMADAVRAAEAEIARRGLMAKYTAILLTEVRKGSQTFVDYNPENPYSVEMFTYMLPEPIRSDDEAWGVLFAIATAPPEVRARAMLQALSH
jgi:hypothetical protein